MNTHDKTILTPIDRKCIWCGDPIQPGEFATFDGYDLAHTTCDDASDPDASDPQIKMLGTANSRRRKPKIGEKGWIEDDPEWLKLRGEERKRRKRPFSVYSPSGAARCSSWEVT